MRRASDASFYMDVPPRPPVLPTPCLQPLLCASQGERYLSTPLYADIEADMNEEELEIAKSTPSFQLIPGEEPVLQA